MVLIRTVNELIRLENDSLINIPTLSNYLTGVVLTESPSRAAVFRHSSVISMAVSFSEASANALNYSSKTDNEQTVTNQNYRKRIPD